MYLMCGVSPRFGKHERVHKGYCIEQSCEFVMRSVHTHDVCMVLVTEYGQIMSPIHTAWNIQDRVTQEFKRVRESGNLPHAAFMIQTFSKARPPLHVVVGVLRGYNPYYAAFCAAMQCISSLPQYVQYVLVPAAMDAAAAFAALKTCVH